MNNHPPDYPSLALYPNRLFDASDSGSLTLTELQEGIAKLPLSRKCNMTFADYEEMTADLVGFDEDGEKSIDFVAFDQLIRKELRAFAQRNLGPCALPPTRVPSALLRDGGQSKVTCHCAILQLAPSETPSTSRRKHFSGRSKSCLLTTRTLKTCYQRRVQS
jgi:hypothetical protein